MYPAPSLDEVRRILKQKPSKIIGILFAPLYGQFGRELLVPRLGYLNARTSKYIHFFCAGYGGYGFADDITKIGDVSYDNGLVIPWGFSPTKFASFVEEFEGATNWRYGGETELILTRTDIAFSECILFDIDAMIRDGTVDTGGRLFETIIQYARENESAAQISDLSDRQGVHVFAESAQEAILNSLPGMAKSLWVHGKHYRTQNLEKA